MSQGLILENEDYPLLTGRRCTLQALADDGMAGVALLSASMSTAICGVSRGHIGRQRVLRLRPSRFSTCADSRMGNRTTKFGLHIKRRREIGRRLRPNSCSCRGGHWREHVSYACQTSDDPWTSVPVSPHFRGGFMRSSPTLLIMDNDRLALRLLSASLKRLLPGCTVLAPVDTGAEAIAVCTSHHCPDLLLADVSMSDINGLVVCRTIRKENWKTSVLMMTSFSVAEYAAEAVASGAQGIIHKDNPKTIAEALLQIKETGICSDRFLNAHDSFLRLKSEKNKDLSPREMEIVDRWARGRSMSDIAEELSIGQTTVRTHLEHAASKLGVANNRALISAWMHLNR